LTQQTIPKPVNPIEPRNAVSVQPSGPSSQPGFFRHRFTPNTID